MWHQEEEDDEGEEGEEDGDGGYYEMESNKRCNVRQKDRETVKHTL